MESSAASAASVRAGGVDSESESFVCPTGLGSSTPRKSWSGPVPVREILCGSQPCALRLTPNGFRSDSGFRITLIPVEFHLEVRDRLGWNLYSDSTVARKVIDSAVWVRTISTRYRVGSLRAAGIFVPSGVAPRRSPAASDGLGAPGRLLPVPGVDDQGRHPQVLVLAFPRQDLHGRPARAIC